MFSSVRFHKFHEKQPSRSRIAPCIKTDGGMWTRLKRHRRAMFRLKVLTGGIYLQFSLTEISNGMSSKPNDWILGGRWQFTLRERQRDSFYVEVTWQECQREHAGSKNAQNSTSGPRTRVHDMVRKHNSNFCTFNAVSSTVRRKQYTN
jgi:hypothetical protein